MKKSRICGFWQYKYYCTTSNCYTRKQTVVRVAVEVRQAM
jgi:hypothetical protein